jgi:hypothetical protein
MPARNRGPWQCVERATRHSRYVGIGHIIRGQWPCQQRFANVRSTSTIEAFSTPPQSVNILLLLICQKRLEPIEGRELSVRVNRRRTSSDHGRISTVTVICCLILSSGTRTVQLHQSSFIQFLILLHLYATNCVFIKEHSIIMAPNKIPNP